MQFANMTSDCPLKATELGSTRSLANRQLQALARR